MYSFLALNSNRRETRAIEHAFSSQAIDPLIYLFMAKTPNDNKWIDRFRSIILNGIAANDLRTRVRQGLDCIKFDLLSHLSRNQVHCIVQQWRNAMKKLFNKNCYQLAREKENWGYITTQEMMNIPESMINYFYESGRRYYLAHQYDKAADVFLLLILLDIFRHNSWFALGLSAEHLCRWNEALNAYAIAALLNEKAPMPHIHSAECYIALHKYEDARASLILAQDILKANPSEANEKLNEYINDLEFRSSGDNL